LLKSTFLKFSPNFSKNFKIKSSLDMLLDSQHYTAQIKF